MIDFNEGYIYKFKNDQVTFVVYSTKNDIISGETFKRDGGRKSWKINLDMLNNTRKSVTELGHKDEFPEYFV